MRKLVNERVSNFLWKSNKKEKPPLNREEEILGEIRPRLPQK